MSLLHPPAGFPAHLAVIWPLIWVQILALRVYVRATWGKGTQYHWSVTPWGHVFIASVDWVPGQDAPVWLKPAAHTNTRIAAALDGHAFEPEYIRLRPLSLGLARIGERTAFARARVGVRGKGVAACAGFAATLLPLTPAPLPGERGLPLPET